MNARWIVGIGGSSGSHRPLTSILERLPADFAGTVLITIHRHAESDHLLSRSLDTRTKIPVRAAEDGARVEPGTAYVAIPDRHLLYVDGHLRLSAAARENRSRPSIDVMLRSIAVACGPGAIGIVLSGLLNDGADGLRAIKTCGGRALIQDPTDAEYPQMPEMAARATVLDLALPAEDIAAAIQRIVLENPPEAPAGRSCPAEMRAEVDMALGKRLGLSAAEEFGTNSNVTCPECGGALRHMPTQAPVRLRCHTGHAYTADVLAQLQAEKVEEAMFVAMRTLRERASTLRGLADRSKGAAEREAWNERANEADALGDQVAETIVTLGGGGRR